MNRNAFPITFVSVLDNFTKGRMVGVMISQFTDEQTYSKCLSELKWGNLRHIKPQCSMADFDMVEILGIRNTWAEAVILIFTFHAIAGQSKWIDRNVPKPFLEMLKEKFKELHFVENEKKLKQKLASLKRYCTVKGLHTAKEYLIKSWEPYVAM